MRFHEQVPVLRCVRDAVRQRDLLTLAFLALLAVSALVVGLLPVSPAIQWTFLRAHHLRPTSLQTWVLVQPLPKMYGSAHQTFTVPREITPEELDEGRTHGRHAAHRWLNHYPAKNPIFGDHRVALSLGTRTHTLLIHSRYGDARLVTAYRITPERGGIRIEVAGGRP